MAPISALVQSCLTTDADAVDISRRAMPGARGQRRSMRDRASASQEMMVDRPVAPVINLPKEATTAS